MRGNDGKIRGFVNACRHRGNPLFSGDRARPQRIVLASTTCGPMTQQGKLRGYAPKPEIDKDAYGLLEVPVDTFAGFVFLNPAPPAAAAARFPRARTLSDPGAYHSTR